MIDPNALSPHLIEVKIDQRHHLTEAATDEQRLTWKYMDTSYSLLRELAARIVLAQLRESAPERVPASDDEAFRMMVTGDAPDDAPTGLADIASASKEPMEMFQRAFNRLLEITVNEAVEEMNR